MSGVNLIGWLSRHHIDIVAAVVSAGSRGAAGVSDYGGCVDRDGDAIFNWPNYFQCSIKLFAF